MTDPQTAADAAERVPLTAAQEVRAYLSTPVTPAWFDRELVAGLLAEHDEAVSLLEQALIDLKHARDERTDVWLAERLEVLRDATLEAAGLLHRLSGPGPCDYDDDGACRGHDGSASGYLAPCPHPAGRRFVETWGAGQGSAAEKGPESHAPGLPHKIPPTPDVAPATEAPRGRPEGRPVDTEPAPRN